MNLDRIKERISKLLALGKDDAAAAQEAENAMAFARQLMLEHNVSEADLTPHERAARIERMDFAQSGVGTTGRNLSAWEMWLANTIQRVVGTVNHYVSGHEQRRDANGILQWFEDGNPMMQTTIMYYGPEDDVRDATQLFAEWSVTIAAMARMRFGGALKGAGRSYCEGFTRALSQKVSKAIEKEDLMIEEGKSTALVLTGQRSMMVAKQDQGKKWLKDVAGISLQSRGSGAGGGEHHSGAYDQGKKDGSAANLSRDRQRRLGS